MSPDGYSKAAKSVVGHTMSITTMVGTRPRQGISTKITHSLTSINWLLNNNYNLIVTCPTSRVLSELSLSAFASSVQSYPMMTNSWVLWLLSWQRMRFEQFS